MQGAGKHRSKSKTYTTFSSCCSQDEYEVLMGRTAEPASYWLDQEHHVD